MVELPVSLQKKRAEVFRFLSFRVLIPLCVDIVHGAQPPGGNLQDMVQPVRPVEQIGDRLAAPVWPRVAFAVEYRPDVAPPIEMREDRPPNIGALQPNQVLQRDIPQAVDGVALQPLRPNKAPLLPDRPNPAPPQAPPIAPQIPFHRAFIPAGYPNYAFRRPSAAIPKAPPPLAPPLGSPIQDLSAFAPGVRRWTRGAKEPIPRPSFPLGGPAM